MDWVGPDDMVASLDNSVAKLLVGVDVTGAKVVGFRGGLTVSQIMKN